MNQPVSIKYALGCITRTPHLPGDIHEVVAADGERVPPARLGAGQKETGMGTYSTKKRMPSLNVRRRVRRKRSTLTVHEAFTKFKVHREAYYGGIFTGNHAHKCLQV